MKPLVVIIALIAAFAAPVAAQSQDDAKASKPAEKLQKPEINNPAQQDDPAKQNKLKGFIDADGDGLDDRKMNPAGQDQQPGHRMHEGRRMHQRGRDHFIDNDGDGINDNRCNGLGFGKKNRGHRHGGGQK